MAHLDITANYTSNRIQSPIMFNSVDADLLERTSNQGLDNIEYAKLGSSMPQNTRSIRKSNELADNVEKQVNSQINQRLVESTRKNEQAKVSKLHIYRKIYKSTDDRKCRTSKPKRRQNRTKYQQIFCKQKSNSALYQIQKMIKKMHKKMQISNKCDRINKNNELVLKIKTYISTEQKINPSLQGYLHYNLGVCYTKINQASESSVNSEQIISFHLQTAYRQFSEVLSSFQQEGAQYFWIHMVCSRILLHQAGRVTVSSKQIKQFDPLKVLFRASWQSVVGLHKLALAYLKQFPIYATCNRQQQQKQSKILNTIYILLSDLAVNTQYLLSLDFGGQNWKPHKTNMQKQLSQVQYLIQAKWDQIFAETSYQIDSSAINGSVGEEGQLAQIGRQEELRLDHATFYELFGFNEIFHENYEMLYSGIALYAQTLFLMSTQFLKKTNLPQKITTEISQDLLRRCFHICEQYINKSALYYKVKLKYDSYKWGGTCIRQTTKQQESDFEDSLKLVSQQKEESNVKNVNQFKIIFGSNKKESNQSRSNSNQQNVLRIPQRNRHRIRFMRSLEVNLSEGKKNSLESSPKKQNLRTISQRKSSKFGLDPVSTAISRIYEEAHNHQRKNLRDLVQSSQRKRRPKQTQQNYYSYRYNFLNATQEIKMNKNSKISENELLIKNYSIEPEKASQKIDLKSRMGIFFKYKNQRITKIKEKTKM